MTAAQSAATSSLAAEPTSRASGRSAFTEGHTADESAAADDRLARNHSDQRDVAKRGVFHRPTA